MAIKALLIDMDGTLANSEPLKGLAIAETCRQFGAEIGADCYRQVMGEPWAQVLRHFFLQAGIAPPLDEFNSLFKQRYLQLLETEVMLTSGAVDFLHRARALSLRLAVVSSASGWMVDKILTRLHIKSQFELLIAKEQVSRHKPDPEAYQLALARLQLPAREALVFEDSTAGLTAATRAGCQCIGIRHDFNSHHDMSSASHIVSSFDQINLEDWLSPAQ